MKAKTEHNFEKLNLCQMTVQKQNKLMILLKVVVIVVEVVVVVVTGGSDSATLR